jgi:hypothetical protein
MRIEKPRRVEPVQPPEKVRDKPKDEKELPKPMPAKRKKPPQTEEGPGGLDTYA